MQSFVIAAVIGGLAPFVAAAQAGPCASSATPGSRPGVTTCPTVGAITVDAALTEPAWSGATPIALQFEVSPGNNTPTRTATTCFTTFDETHLYLGCRAADPDPRSIRAFYAPRDEIAGHDRIGFVFDPFNDSRRAFEFVVSALGVQADGVFDSQQGAVDQSWDAIWKSAGRIDAQGYTVEAAIPFKSLRFPRVTSQESWGFYAWRSRPRSQDVETRSVPLDRGNGCLLCQAGLLTGLRDISPSRNVQLTPTTTASRTDARTPTPTSPLGTGDVDAETSVDARWSPSPNISVAATVNPDFSHIEADVAQLDVNNRFTLFFPEKRPFFLDGAEFYTTPMRAVYTRTISNPRYGGQVNGKLGRTSMGGLVAGDRVNALLLPGNQGSSTAPHGGGITSVVGRIRQDLGASSTLGLLYTGREGAGYHNRVLGADGLFQPTRPVTVRVQALGSRTGYEEAFAAAYSQPRTPFAGVGGLGQANYNSRTWRAQALVRAIDADLRADAGFVEQVDVREINAWGQRQFWGRAGEWFSRVNLTSGFWNRTRFDGFPTERVFWGNVLYRGPKLLDVFVDHQRRREFYQGEYFTLARYRADLGIAPTRDLRLSLNSRAGDAIDLANGRKADQWEVIASVQWKIGRHIDLNVSHELEGLNNGDASVVTAHLPQLAGVINFSTRSYLRINAQYRDTERNPDAFASPVESRRQHLFSRVLYAYEANPQTLLYLGYSDDRTGFTDASGVIEPMALRGRSFFLKMSYAWRP